MIYNYFNQTEGKHLPIPHPCQVVKDIPFGIRAVVHKSIIKEGFDQEGYTVTDLASGARLAEGDTRAIAIEAAKSKVLAVGQTKYLAAVDSVIAKYGPAN